MLTISLFTNVIHNPPRVPSMYFIPLIIVLPYNQNFNQNYMTFNWHTVIKIYILVLTTQRWPYEWPKHGHYVIKLHSQIQMHLLVFLINFMHLIDAQNMEHIKLIFHLFYNHHTHTTHVSVNVFLCCIHRVCSFVPNITVQLLKDNIHNAFKTKRCRNASSDFIGRPCVSTCNNWRKA